MARESSVSSKTPRRIGWQGFTLNVPEVWDLTGFSGTVKEGYFRVDDSEEQSVEVKWATESARSKTEPDPDGRREIFFNSLRKRAKREKLPLETNEVDTYRPVQLSDRVTAPFRWTGDRRGIGAVWYCRACRRVVIAQVLGDRSGKGGLNGVAEAVLSSLKCHGEDEDWRTWSLYGLTTEIPAEYELASQQLMNVYLRLSFASAKSTARLSVEQWSLANMARRGAYLDTYVSANAKGELREATYEATEGKPVLGHPALQLSGGLKLGMPMINAMKQVGRLQRPATRFRGCAWECEPSNSLYLVESLRPPRVRDVTDEVAARDPVSFGKEKRMIKYLKERIVGGKPKYTRAQVIASRPIRNPVVKWDRTARGDEQPSVALLLIPRRHDRWGDIVAKMLKLPDNRKLELDEIGSDVWEMCDGSFTVDAITRAISTKYRLNRRQSETSVTAYLRQLAERRLVAVQTKVAVTSGAKAPAVSQKRKRA